jgi:hypothetical protein
LKRATPQLRIAALLGVACAISTAALFPYLLALKPGLLATSAFSPGIAVAAATLQGGVICFLLAWIGLKLGAPLGLGAPWLAAWLYDRPRPIAADWLLAALLGALTSVAILALMAVFGATPDLAQPHLPAAWKGLLASFYGATTEEVSLRVFLMGSLAWMLARAAGGTASPWLMITTIVMVAVLFGAGHLPIAAQLGTLTVGVVARVIIYNALLGVAFGWLYWRRGLEHAMLAHFCADIVLHVVAPALTR